MEVIQFFIDLLREPQVFINQWISDFGAIWVYAPLFIIIFIETGLVIMPFLPGDSLLFAAGAIAGTDNTLSPLLLIGLLGLAAVLGNTSNYWIGRKVGQKIIESGRVKSLTPKRIAKTQAMFDKYGLLAVVLTRFFPIIRTFAPFLAGVGGMHFARFTLFNEIGGVLWVSLFTLLGYFFGRIPFVQENFSLVVLAIIAISFIPAIVGVVRAILSKRKAKKEAQDAQAKDPKA